MRFIYTLMFVVFVYIPQSGFTAEDESGAFVHEPFPKSLLADSRIHQNISGQKLSPPWISNSDGTAYFLLEQSQIVECIDGKADVSFDQPDSFLDVAIPANSAIYRPVSYGPCGVIVNAFWFSHNMIMATGYSGGRWIFFHTDSERMTVNKSKYGPASSSSPGAILKKYYASDCVNVSSPIKKSPEE